MWLPSNEQRVKGGEIHLRALLITDKWKKHLKCRHIVRNIAKAKMASGCTLWLEVDTE
jgi:hypothetical protein